MRAGKLRHRITIQELSITKDPDGYNEDIENWVDFKKVWAEIEPLKGKEYWAAKQVVGEVTGRMKIRYLEGVNEKMRVIYGSKTYDIEAVINVDEKNKEMQLLVKEDLND